MSDRSLRRWKRIDTENVIDHPMVKVRRDTCALPDGRVIDDYYVVDENNFALIFAVTPEREVVFVEQYKHGLGDICTELPGGYFDSADPDAEAEARRELREETGYDAPDWHLVSVMHAHPTRMSNMMYVFAVPDARPVTTQNLDENEDIRVRLVPLDQLAEMLRDGEFNITFSIAAIYMAWDFLKRQGYA